MIRTNVAIRTRTPELVEFFYPNFTKISEYSPFISGGVIFEGDSKYLQSFRDNKVPYIYVKGTPEYDLTVPENLLNFVFDKWDKKPTKALEDYFRSYDKVNTELENIAKIIWVTGKYTIEETVDNKLSGLYKLLSRSSTYLIFNEYLKLSDTMNKESLFYNIQSFLKKANNLNEINSVYVKKCASDFNEARGNNVEGALMQYLYSKSDNVELKMLKLFDALAKIK